MFFPLLCIRVVVIVDYLFAKFFGIMAGAYRKILFDALYVPTGSLVNFSL